MRLGSTRDQETGMGTENSETLTRFDDSLKLDVAKRLI